MCRVLETNYLNDLKEVHIEELVSLLACPLIAIGLFCFDAHRPHPASQVVIN